MANNLETEKKVLAVDLSQCWKSPPVKTAKDAVKVAIAHEVRESKKN